MQGVNADPLILLTTCLLHVNSSNMQGYCTHGLLRTDVMLHTLHSSQTHAMPSLIPPSPPPSLPASHPPSLSLPSRHMRTWQPHTCVPCGGSSGCPTTHMQFSQSFSSQRTRARCVRGSTVAHCSYSYSAAATAATAHGSWIPGSPVIRVKLRVRLRLTVRVGVGVSSRGRGQSQG